MATMFENYAIQCYRCDDEDCRRQGVPTPYRELDDGDCPHCGGRMTWCKSAKPDYVTVAMYETDRAYGGPEEGGWYFNTGDLVQGTQRSFTWEDEPQAQIYMEVLLRRTATTRGYEVRVWPQEDAPKHYPDRRPYYC